MVSIKDIAAECSVSPATVSKALNGHDDVSAATSQRIRDAAKRLGYLPNSMAQALKTRKTYNIGVLMVDRANNGLRHHYFAAILDSFKVRMERCGYDLTFISSQIGEKTYSYHEHCVYRNVDGVLAACVDFETPEIQTLLRSDLPIVSIDYIFENGVSVNSDNAAGIRSAVEYALKMGHVRFAYIHGEESQVTRVRMDTFRQVLAEYNCEVDPSHVKKAKYLHPEVSYQLTQELLSGREIPTCILYPDDICAMSGMKAIRERGLAVGRDVSVIGYDGHPFFQMISPRLTTVCQDTEGIGQKAAELMLRLLRKEDLPPSERIRYCKGYLNEGDTVGPLR